MIELDESELRLAGMADRWDQVAGLAVEARSDQAHLVADPRDDGTTYRVIDAADYREVAHEHGGPG